MEFSRSDRIVCIDPSNSVAKLTKDKVYPVIGGGEGVVQIQDDNGVIRTIFATRFQLFQDNPAIALHTVEEVLKTAPFSRGSGGKGLIRVRVNGGWLYIYEIITSVSMTSSMQFVPDSP